VGVHAEFACAAIEREKFRVLVNGGSHQDPACNTDGQANRQADEQMGQLKGLFASWASQQHEKS
jgi:hypothetical protein